jgi:S1-C subfamily serine protease
VRFYHLPAESGVRVMSVEPGGPAEEADLLSGDIIVAYAGCPVPGIDELQRLLTGEQVGVRSRLTIIRRTELHDVDVVPQESGSRPRRRSEGRQTSALAG